MSEETSFSFRPHCLHHHHHHHLPLLLFSSSFFLHFSSLSLFPSSFLLLHQLPSPCLFPLFLLFLLFPFLLFLLFLFPLSSFLLLFASSSSSSLYSSSPFLPLPFAFCLF